MRLSTGFVGFGLLAMLHVGSGLAQTPTEIQITAADYSFSPLPAHISAGSTVFSFENQGKVQHELSIYRLAAGATPEQAVKVLRDGGARKGIIERSVGLLIAGPGKSPDGRILVELRPATTYLLVCNLSDHLGGPGHLALGMYTSFRTE